MIASAYFGGRIFRVSAAEARKRQRSVSFRPTAGAYAMMRADSLSSLYQPSITALKGHRRGIREREKDVDMVEHTVLSYDETMGKIR
jgi:hypothetical protein